MKSFPMLLLMLSTVNSFAQNLDINDLRQLIGLETKDSIDIYLSGKGFTYGPKKLDLKKSGTQIGDSWMFVSYNKGQTTVLSSINSWQDSAGKMISYETSNPYFYTDLLNQLGKEGFSYQEAIPDKSDAVLNFSNGPETILIMLQQSIGQFRFQFQYKKSGNNSANAVRRRSIPAKRAIHNSRPSIRINSY